MLPLPCPTAEASERTEFFVGHDGKILSECGLSASQAIKLFYRQVILERGMPFRIKSFNEENDISSRTGC